MDRTSSRTSSTWRRSALVGLVLAVVTLIAGPFHPVASAATTDVVVGAGKGVTLVFTPAANYRLADVTVDGVSIGPVASYRLESVQADHDVNAVFEYVPHVIRVAAPTNGAISPSGDVRLPPDGSQTFSIVPSAGYVVADVTVDGASVGAVTSYAFTHVTGDHTLAATFALNRYTVTASAGPNGTISPSGAVTVSRGASQTFAIAPAPGYRVADVTVDGASVGAVTSYTLSNVTANHAIAATFAADTFTVTATAGVNGSISPSGAVTVARAGSQKFTITPSAGYKVADVTVDGASVGAVTSYTLANVIASHAIAATFAADIFTVTAAAGANGAISPSGAVTVTRGASQTFAITPASGYRVDDVKVNGASVGAVTSYTVASVTADATVTASFTRAEFRIAVTITGDGTVSSTIQ